MAAKGTGNLMSKTWWALWKLWRYVYLFRLYTRWWGNTKSVDEEEVQQKHNSQRENAERVVKWNSVKYCFLHFICYFYT